MHSDILDLREFYLSSLGFTVRRMLRRRLERFWPSLKSERILALGYGTPLLRPWLEEKNTVLSMMPASQGVTYWPREGPNVSSLVDMENLPLPDLSIDRVVLLHALEGTADVQSLTREIHRVLKSQGRLLIMVPNRLGFWAHSDRTPFGNGEPYSATQVRNALHGAGFLIDRTVTTLFFPPTSSRLVLSLADYIEKFGEKVYPSFGGLLFIEASKQLYAPLLTKAKPRQHRLILPLPLPVSTPPVPAGRI